MFRRTYLTPNVGSTSRFFHLWQIFSRDPCVPGTRSFRIPAGGLAHDKRRADRDDGTVSGQHRDHRPSSSFLRRNHWCRLPFHPDVVRPDCLFATLASLTKLIPRPRRSFWGRTVVHTLSITYGEFGRISYNVVEKGKPAVSLLRFNAVGEMGGAASLKVRFSSLVPFRFVPFGWSEADGVTQLGMYRAAEGVPTGAETFLAGYTAVRVT